MRKIVEKLEHSIGVDNLIERINAGLSGSAFNSFLLALFKKRTANLSPSALLRAFNQNRFVTPATTDAILYKQAEIDWLKQGVTAGFSPVQLSPLAPLGTSSAFGFVDQNQVVSATRGSEVVSDGTNVLAMHIANQYKSAKVPAMFRYCTTHRFVRAQNFSDPRFLAIPIGTATCRCST